VGLLAISDLAGFGDQEDHAVPPAHYEVLTGSEAACADGWERVVEADRARALAWIGAAVVKLRAYDGSQGATRKALETHFHATAPWFAKVIAWHLDKLQAVAPLANYLCRDASSGPCAPGGGLTGRLNEGLKSGGIAWAMWCLPFFRIRICPGYFTSDSEWRVRALVHEWSHKYLCMLDVGYADQPGYESHSSFRNFFNADSWSMLVYELQ